MHCSDDKVLLHYKTLSNREKVAVVNLETIQELQSQRRRHKQSLNVSHRLMSEEAKEMNINVRVIYVLVYDGWI